METTLGSAIESSSGSRQLWEEGPGNCRPGYGKYDRALGVQYMLGVWDLLDRLDEEKKKG